MLDLFIYLLIGRDIFSALCRVTILTLNVLHTIKECQTLKLFFNSKFPYRTAHNFLRPYKHLHHGRHRTETRADHNRQLYHRHQGHVHHCPVSGRRDTRTPYHLEQSEPDHPVGFVTHLRHSRQRFDDRRREGVRQRCLGVSRQKQSG